MSYPKKTTKPKTGKSAKDEKEWEKQRDKNYGIQKRDQLKSLLLGKFKTKYVTELKDPKMEALIANEVLKFISQSTLTEANLQKLDTQIGELLKSKVEVHKPKPAEGHGKTDHKPESVKAKEGSKKETAPDKGTPTTAEEKKAEDSWACIVDYNKKQYDGEQQALLAKQKDMKIKMKQELDKQIESKKKIQEEQKRKEKETEEIQVKLETDLEHKDKIKDLKQKERVVKETMEAQDIFESI